MKIVKKLILGVIAVYMFSILTVNASEVVISGNSVFRKSATSASVNFISNSDGYVYYIVNEKSTAIIDELTEDAGSITNGETKTISISSELLSSGAKYVHIVVKDVSNEYSNILNIAMPKDVYYYDDFEAYNIDTYPYFFNLKHNGGNALNQKIISLNGNKVFNGYGTYATGLDERIAINTLSTGYAVLEANISATTLPTDYYYGGISLGADDSSTRHVIVQVRMRTNLFFANNNGSSTEFKVNKNYNVKIIVDVANNKYDYYINGIKVNTIPITADSFDELTWFGIYNGNGTIHYDNMKFYSQSTNPILSISKGAEINGTFTTDKTIAEQNELITVTPMPEEGYRVKSVKINNSESGIIKNNSNYEFTMPAEDVVIKVEFEKIPLTITTNTVTGATISPNGTVNALYGDNKEITIISDLGYRLKSVKVNDEEKLPLTDNKIRLDNIIENHEIEVKVEKIEYDIINGDGQKHIIGKNEDAVFRIDADKELFLKVYLNDEELDSVFYTITEGSTIITLKKDFLNNLLPNTYNLRAIFADGGESNATFVIEQPIENNPKTGDEIIISIIIGIISLIGLLGTSVYFKKEI